MIDEYIYVDYENVQDIKVEFIKNTSIREVKIDYESSFDISKTTAIINP